MAGWQGPKSSLHPVYPGGFPDPSWPDAQVADPGAGRGGEPESAFGIPTLGLLWQEKRVTGKGWEASLLCLAALGACAPTPHPAFHKGF